MLQKTNLREYYSPSQLAKELGVSERTIYKWRKNGLRYLKIGQRTIRFHREDVREFLMEKFMKN